jgi:hypothetical protein
VSLDCLDGQPEWKPVLVFSAKHEACDFRNCYADLSDWKSLCKPLGLGGLPRICCLNVSDCFLNSKYPIKAVEGHYPTAFLALKRLGAKDWKSGLGLSLTHQGKQHFVEAHHIFPKSLLQKANVDSRPINEIANLAFVGSAANKWISTRPPSECLPLVIAERGEEELSRHAIPLNAELWKLENFADYLIYRRQALANRINDLLQSCRIENDEGRKGSYGRTP